MNNAYGIQNKGTKSFTLIQVVQALSEMLYIIACPFRICNYLSSPPSYFTMLPHKNEKEE